jgi:hypothetical protein
MQRSPPKPFYTLIDKSSLLLVGESFVKEGFGFGAIGAHEQLPMAEEQGWVKEI